MGVHIDISQTRSPAASVASASEDEDDLHETEANVSPIEPSPHFSATQPTSHSGSSSHASEYIPLPLQYPSELHEGGARRDVNPSDSASRLDRHERPQNSRTHSLRREAAPRRQAAPGYNQPRSRPRSEIRVQHDNSPTESGDSTEEFLAEPDFYPQMPRPTTYHAPNGGYPQSNSSTGSYAYPPVHPPTTQVVHYAHQGQGPPMHPYHPHQQQHHHHAYPPVSSPPVGYPPPIPHPTMPYGAPQYTTSPYGPPAVIQQNPYAPPQGYFHGGYAPQYQPGYPQPHPYPPHAVPPLPAFMDAWRVSPHPGNASAVSSSSSEKPAIDQEELLKQMKALMASSNAEREAKEKERQAAIKSAEDQAAAIKKAEQERQREEAVIRAEALKAATDQAEIAARARADRAADEARIRREAKEAAEKAIAAAAAAAAEQQAREAKIREEAAKAALEAAAAEAKAKTEQEAREKKIASEAREAAKSEAEKKAADDAQKAEEAAKKAKEEAEKKVLEAEEAAKKAKAEAEAAQAKADAATPAEKKAPVRFKDAIGRNYNFPWERCHKWRDMEGLIIQAFQHIEDLGDHVINRRYDLLGPDKEIIMPEYWDVTVQPDMSITMALWPLPEKPAEPAPIAPPIDGILDLDAILNPKKKTKKKAGGGLSGWMLGSRPKKTGKPSKKAP